MERKEIRKNVRNKERNILTCPISRLKLRFHYHYVYLLISPYIYASSQENLSSGFQGKRGSKPVSPATETSQKTENLPVASLHNLTFQKVNNKGADQTARMRRLVCACVVRKPPKTGFSPVAAHIYLRN